MAFSFRNLSIRKKLTALMMLVSVLILLLVSSLYIAEEVYSSRTFLEREMTTLGTTLGDSCKKLLMLRRIDTTEEILASLQAQPNIHAAYLFDEDGTPVAQYLDPSEMKFILSIIPRDFVDPDNKFWTKLSRPKITSSWQHFSLFLPIQHGDRTVGSLYLVSDLHDLYGRLSGVVFVTLLLLGLLVFFSWWLAGQFQRPVSVPLLNLAETMSSISQSKNYSLRAERQGRDEVGLLVDGFNHMLGQIETNRQELVDHQQSLEATVDKRTEELQQVISVLEVAKQQAESASEAKSQFLANITHELRTPLIGVLGMNELMFRTTMDVQQQMLATTVQHSGEDLLTLINNVLDFSKIEAGKLQLEEEEFALYRVVEEVLTLLAGPATEKGLSLYSEIPLTATCRVLGDEVRIRQILMNLIGNAVKFTEHGSVTITLSCGCPTTDAAEFSIEIIDTGIGMDEETQQQIFSAFYQADASHTRKYGGTGLGLAIVLQLVQLLEGDVQLESSVGSGSTFRVGFTLPLAAASELSLPETLRQQPVLIYTLDPVCQQQLSNRLHALGMKVVTAESVEDAWYQLASAGRAGKPFQLMFLSADALLPDGQLLYLAIREDQNLVGMRRLLLLTPAQSIEPHEQERKLYLPVGWDNLHETLCQSWHELHLVKNVPQTKKELAAENESATQARILLVGGSVASRELLKISMVELPIDIEDAADFSQLQDKTEYNTYDAVFLDVAAIPSDRLLSYCRQQHVSSYLWLLCSLSDDVTELLPHVAGRIEKPVKREQLQSILQPLLDAGTASPDQQIDVGRKA